DLASEFCRRAAMECQTQPSHARQTSQGRSRVEKYVRLPIVRGSRFLYQLNETTMRVVILTGVDPTDDGKVIFTVAKINHKFPMRIEEWYAHLENGNMVLLPPPDVKQLPNKLHIQAASCC